MVLGNSYGNNKGKKYLRKNEIDIVYAAKAEHFNNWISENYNSLIHFLKSKEIFESDVFHETYNSIYEKILYSDIQCSDYWPYIMRAYYTNFINNKCKEKRYCELLPNCDVEDLNNDIELEQEEIQKRLSNDVFDYVYSNYGISEFELFKMYMSLKPAINYPKLAIITNMKSHEIQKIISMIKRDVQKEFSERRKETL